MTTGPTTKHTGTKDTGTNSPPSVIPANAGTHGHAAPANGPNRNHGPRRPPG